VEGAVAAATELGFPVAVKALGLAHKSEHDAVRLNMRDPEAVRIAAGALLPLGDGLLVECMVQGPVAELIAGVTRDPLFGPVMTIGTGGVLVELLADSRTLLLPARKADIEAALRSLKMFPLLDGFRGRPKAEIAAVLDALEGIARFAVDNASTLIEMDVNPLIATRNGAWIADALIVESADWENRND
jgi:acetate---CoA ligase (ADP-forming)